MRRRYGHAVTYFDAASLRCLTPVNPTLAGVASFSMEPRPAGTIRARRPGQGTGTGPGEAP